MYKHSTKYYKYNWTKGKKRARGNFRSYDSIVFFPQITLHLYVFRVLKTTRKNVDMHPLTVEMGKQCLIFTASCCVQTARKRKYNHQLQIKIIIFCFFCL